MKKLILLALSAVIICGCDPQTNAANTLITNAVTDSSTQTTEAPIPVQEIAADLTAKNYLIVLDNSGSMDEQACGANGETKMQIAKKAIGEFINTIPSDANVGLNAFWGIDNIALKPNNTGPILSALNTIRPGYGTPLRTAITQGGNELKEVMAKQLKYGEYHLIVVTDGEAGWGEDPKPIVDNLVQSTPIIIHTVGFCIGGQHSLNSPSVVYTQATDTASLVQGLKAVLAESQTFDTTSFRK